MEKASKTNFFSSDAWKKVKKLFGEYDMTWKRVIIFAVITAVITAVLNLIPALKDTSFQDIAINLECWILFAVFIIVNCKTWKEAALKCFVFFLVSQPLIYLIEVPFVSLGWGIFQYYKYWAILTLITLPGAVIAFLVKKKNWLSVLILSVATGYLAYMSATYFKTAAFRFPHHLLSAIFCLALAIFLIIVLIGDDKIKRSVAILAVALVFAVTFMINSTGSSTTLALGDGSWTCSVEDESVVTVEITDGGEAEIKPVHDGHSYIYFTDADGNVHEYYATVSGGSVWLDDMAEA